MEKQNGSFKIQKAQISNERQVVKDIASVLLLSTLALSASDSYVDLGVQGFQYEIIEKNGADMISEKIKDVNKTKIINHYTRQIDDAFHSNIHMPVSMQDLKTSKPNIQRARWDIVSPNGDVILKKGEVIPREYLKISPFSICFIDGGQSHEAVNYLLDVFGRRCKYMVNNIDSREFETLYSVQAYPVAGQNKEYMEFFHVTHFPTKVSVTSKSITTETLNMKRVYREIRDAKNQ